MSIQLCKIFSPAVNLQEYPGKRSAAGDMDSQMLHGELFNVLAFNEDLPGTHLTWAKGRGQDGYEGWLPDTALMHATIKPTHAVTVAKTPVYMEPAGDCPVEGLEFSFMSRLTLELGTTENGFLRMRSYSPDVMELWVPESNILAIDALAAKPADILDTAKMFLGNKYVYGGRTHHNVDENGPEDWGTDCSGLVQLAFQRNALPCPRDSNQQMTSIGRPVDIRDIQTRDIVFFDGHVGIMVDDKNIINATQRHGKVVIEPLAEMMQEYGEPGKRILAVRRMDFYA
jgi:cell wall-associated NlpC family hydrolase